MLRSMFGPEELDYFADVIKYASHSGFTVDVEDACDMLRAAIERAQQLSAIGAATRVQVDQVGVVVEGCERPTRWGERRRNGIFFDRGLRL